MLDEVEFLRFPVLIDCFIGDIPDEERRVGNVLVESVNSPFVFGRHRVELLSQGPILIKIMEEPNPIPAVEIVFPFGRTLAQQPIVQETVKSMADGGNNTFKV